MIVEILFCILTIIFRSTSRFEMQNERPLTDIFSQYV